jgi:hypothetical protein
MNKISIYKSLIFTAVISTIKLLIFNFNQIIF